MEESELLCRAIEIIAITVMYKNYSVVLLIVLYTTKIFFRTIIFSHSLCPNLEGIKDVLCYKFRRPTIGQICSAVCTNKGGYRDAFSSERRKAPHVSEGLLSRLHATEPRTKQETRSVL